MDGLEVLAVAYGWPPHVGRDLPVTEFAEWVSRGQRWIRNRFGAGDA